MVQTSTGYPVDISFERPGYKDEVMDRIVEQEISLGRKIRFCSAEDLIVHKSIAGRVQDMIDVQRVIARQKNKLDAAYIRYWLNVFSDLLETDDVTNRFEHAWRKYGPES